MSAGVWSLTCPNPLLLPQPVVTWAAWAACTKPHRLPVPIQYAAEGRTSHPGGSAFFFVDTLSKQEYT